MCSSPVPPGAEFTGGRADANASSHSGAQTVKLVRMANQIATFFASQPSTDRAGEVADHLHAFWDPRMRHALLAHLAAGGAGLSPIAAEAAQRLRETQPT